MLDIPTFINIYALLVFIFLIEQLIMYLSYFLFPCVLMIILQIFKDAWGVVAKSDHISAIKG